MSEADVSLIQDEDVLRRMWQQTEDFSLKKEIRAHMFRLREERLRNLYSPEPNAGKGCATETRVSSLGDQTFERLKSKEVRDAGSPAHSPPRDLACARAAARPQEVSQLSAAGLEVHSTDRITDDGRTRVRGVTASGGGAGDVDGGTGAFTVRSQQRQADSRYTEGNTSVARSESAHEDKAHEQMFRKTDNGTEFSSSTTALSEQSTYQQTSTQFPYDYDLNASNTKEAIDKNNYENFKQTNFAKQENIKTNDCEIKRTDYDNAELISRKVDYPDENTKVIVETRRLPDGTKVTSTRKEFKTKGQSTRTESATKNTSKFSSSSYRSDSKEAFDTREINIVDSQRKADDFDFRKNQIEHIKNDFTLDDKRIEKKESSSKITREEHNNIDIQTNIDEYEFKKNLRAKTTQNNDHSTQRQHSNKSNKREIITTNDINVEKSNQNETKTGETDRSSSVYKENIKRDIKQTQNKDNDTIYIQKTSKGVENVIEKEKDEYHTTYQTDYSQTKVSNDWSPTHQAWASTLRADTPTRSTQGSSPATMTQSTNSLGSSISPDKTYRSTSRGNSPSKTDRSERYSTHTQTSETNRYSIPDGYRSHSAYKRGPSSSPERKGCKCSEAKGSPTKSVSPDRKTGYQRPTASSPDRKCDKLPSLSPERISKINKKDDYYTLIDEETKMYTRSDKDSSTKREFTSPIRYSVKDKSPSPPDLRCESPSILRKASRSPSPPKGPVTFIHDEVDKSDVTSKQENIRNRHDSPKNYVRQPSPSKYGTYDKKQDEETKVVITSKNAREEKFDSLTHKQRLTKVTDFPSYPSNKTRDSVSPVKHVSPREPSPSKFNTYGKKRREIEHTTETSKDSTDFKYESLTRRQEPTQKILEPSTNKSRYSISPVSSSAKDSKHKHSSDFISTERTTEEINKKVAKERPRQLVTPSTSPTRKPKVDETAPSTGQSSPTTSVSGFVYFGSPTTERNTIVTDLDDDFYFENNTVTNTNTSEYKRPESLPIRSPSPSKIPCKSPVSPKTSLPRKSSLKKPSTDSLLSPSEKPPSTFRVSPSEDIEHKVVKKDRPDKNEISADSPVKQKPPFERRETYEERCKKILGMIDDVTKTKSKAFVEPKSNLSSPCDSPEPFKSSITIDKKQSTQVTDFITREQEDTMKKTTRCENISTERKSKTPSREASPTKLQDIISQKTVSAFNEITDIKDVISKTTRQSPNRDIGYDEPKKSLRASPQRSSISPEKILSIPKEGNKSPERKPVCHKTKRSSPFKEPSSDGLVRSRLSPELIPNHRCPSLPNKMTPEKKPVNESKETPRTLVSPDRKPSFTKSTVPTKHDSNTRFICDEISITTRQSVDKETGYSRPQAGSPHRTPEYARTTSPEPRNRTSVRSSSERKASKSPEKTDDKSPRSSPSPDRKPSYMRPTASSLMHEETTSEHIREAITNTVESKKVRESIEQMHSRTPSPQKTTQDAEFEIPRDGIPQEILNKVPKSLRKLSSSRDQSSSSRDKSPSKPTVALHDIDVISSIDTEVIKVGKVTKDEILTKSTIKSDVSRKDKSKDTNLSTKVLSSLTSPTKKPSGKADKIPEHPKTSRSVSPKKHVSPTERSQSPQVPRINGTKPKELAPTSLTKKPTFGTKTEKSGEVNKTTGLIKQNSLTKISVKVTKPTTPTKEPEPKRVPTPKRLIKENVISKKEEIKFTRTASDSSIKKKPTPQRVKSKPEIQVNYVATSKVTQRKQNTKKSPSGEQQAKLAAKPKSATALNTPLDDDDIIIDVEQAKSSRENSPDRICPTPVGFLEDVGTPRYPDEVKEPDDEFRNRIHHTIHESESIVDDIVEISGEDELFVKRTERDRITESDECLLSVTDKVSKFTNKIETVNKLKDSTAQFKDTEKKVHSDFFDDKLKSDECLLSVTEKVNRFAKGPKDSGDKIASRNITEEYDTKTIYTDDYTKMSLNDKAHLFVETAENSKTTKISPQKIERPDLTNVEESLKSDDCLLSVSDKVNKFVRTAEQFLIESQDAEDKEKKIKEQYEEFMKNITHEEDKKAIITDVIDRKSDQNTPSFAKETASSHTKIKDYPSPNLKSTERAPPVKITTLRSSEAVKKAKALFENIATSQKTGSNATKLLDIGVNKTTKKDLTTDFYPSLDESVNETDKDIEADSRRTPTSDRLSSGSPTTPRQPETKPNRFVDSPKGPRTQSPLRQTIATKSVLSKYPATQNDLPKRPEVNRKQTNRYEMPTPEPEVKQNLPTSDKEKVTEIEVSTRRGSGKFGVELRRTSFERNVSCERRRSKDQPQPCIEDIGDVTLLEQMLETVVGYEQRRRIRAQIRAVKTKNEETVNTSTFIKTKNSVTKNKSPERRILRSPERMKSAPIKTRSPERVPIARTQQRIVTESKEKPLLNGHAKETTNFTEKRRPISPEKKAPVKNIRPQSPEKKRSTSPSKFVTKPKQNKFNEYATAYMKKVGLNENDRIKISDKNKTITDHKTETEDHKLNYYKTKSVANKSTSISKSFYDRTTTKDAVEVIKENSKRSPSPEKKRTVQTDRLYQRSPSPDFKRKQSESMTYETKPKTQEANSEVEEPIIEKKKAFETSKNVAEKPSWVTNRNLKKTECRAVTSKKLESKSMGNVTQVCKVIDPITSSYGPGPMDADGRPLFGIKALRNGANYQVKGTIIREEYHSRNGEAPTGSVTVTAYSTQPADLERLLQSQESPPVSRLHGLAAITTRRRVGPQAASPPTKEERRALEQFTVGERRGHDMHVEDRLQGGDRTVDSAQDSVIAENRTEVEQNLKTNQHKHNARTIEARHESKNIETSQKSRLSQNKQELKNIETSQESRNIKTSQESRMMEKKQEARSVSSRQERRSEERTVRQNSVKNLTEKFIKTATEPRDRAAYPKAGLILRSGLRDAHSDDKIHDDPHADSKQSQSSIAQHTSVNHCNTATTRRYHATSQSDATSQSRTSSRRTEKSFLDSSTKVTGVQDILTRMKNADIVIEAGDSSEDSEARALLNKFLGATVLMAGMQSYVTDGNGNGTRSGSGIAPHAESPRAAGAGTVDVDIDHCWDEQVLRTLLEECTDYDQRRQLRARLRALMAEQEACAHAVTEALAGAEETAEMADSAAETADNADGREEEVTVSAAVRRDSSENTSSTSTTSTITTVKTNKVTESVPRPAAKPVSAFTKFKQLEKQTSTTNPKSPTTPSSPGSGALFKFTDPALACSALTIKERLLQWCRDKTRDYENVKLENFSTSWSDGLAFCALVHHFLPDAFDYSSLTADKRRHNFTLAFKVADEKAGIYPLLDVDDMVAMRKPDWKCVFTYVQAIHRRFKDQS